MDYCASLCYHPACLLTLLPHHQDALRKERAAMQKVNADPRDRECTFEPKILKVLLLPLLLLSLLEVYWSTEFPCPCLGPFPVPVLD